MRLKKNLALIAFVICSFALVTTVSSKKQLPPAGNDGDPTTLPQAGQSCVQCHSGSTAQNAAGKVNITFTDAQGNASPIAGFMYVPGRQYKVSFHPTVTAARYGFQLSSLRVADNANGGVLADTSAKTSLTQGPSTKYIGHADADATNSWDFVWTAPAGNEGDIKFYYAFVASNASDTEFGDSVFVGNTVFSADTTVSGIQEPVIGDLQVYPTISKDVVTISFNAADHGRVLMQLYAINGQLVKQQQDLHAPAYYNGRISVNDLEAGVYLLKITDGIRSSTRKIVVQ